jgi:hypothetical protein
MLPIYLESTPKRTFASAVDWPGWARSGRDEASALQALFDSAQRFAQVVRRAGIEFPLLPTREAVHAALAAAARGETPTQRPRGGAVWSPRYFVRRSGWHVLDHTWEIEDRLGIAL